MITIKQFHILCVSLTFLFFLLRSIWMMLESPVLQQPWVKIMPHGIDTCLLGSGIYLVINLHQYPFSQAWLTAKFFGLVTYIILGSIALKHGRTKTIRVMAVIAALIVFFYIVRVARTHYPIFL